ncbi:PHD finger protein 11 [Phyllobates terribilis]|uniref:PHD finger protein 11 n=1 Tax=Phyllobates terribilis TaxID=111132 RepID=UPI003CCAD1F0
MRRSRVVDGQRPGPALFRSHAPPSSGHTPRPPLVTRPDAFSEIITYKQKRQYRGETKVTGQPQLGDSAMSPQDICDFCGLSEGSATAGELQSTVDGSVVAHYYCMLFSPMVTEKDSQEDAEGFGFNIESVISEIDRGQKLRCTFCKKRGATVGCDVQSCKRNYHYPCLIRAKGKPIPRKFIVYCSKHKYSTNANDLERLQRKQKRKRQQKSTSRPRNNYIRNRRNDDDSERWQRDRKRTKLQNTAGRAR